jgi:hypothetical protein
MTNNRKIAIFVCLLSVSFGITPSNAQPKRARVVNPDTITLYVPAFFSDPPPLGLNVATVLGLQAWQTLRRAPPRGGSGDDFGEGIVRWTPAPLKNFGQDIAEATARRMDILAQIVLWGKAYQYGNGVVVLGELSLPRYDDFRTRSFETWKVRIDAGGGKLFEIEADVPSRRYSFEPFTLPLEIVDKFSRPDALPVYSDPNGRIRVGTLPPVFEARRSDATSVEVRVAGEWRWVFPPKISEARTEISDFVGGLIRIFRGDWAGARDLFGNVTANESTSTRIKIDSYLLRAYAATRLGLPPDSDLAAAEKLNPNAVRVTMYRAMALLESISQATAKDRPGLVKSLRELLEKNSSLFDPSDNWYVACRRLLESL